MATVGRLGSRGQELLWIDRPRFRVCELRVEGGVDYDAADLCVRAGVVNPGGEGFTVSQGFCAHFFVTYVAEYAVVIGGSRAK